MYAFLGRSFCFSAARVLDIVLLCIAALPGLLAASSQNLSVSVGGSSFLDLATYKNSTWGELSLVGDSVQHTTSVLTLLNSAVVLQTSNGARLLLSSIVLNGTSLGTVSSTLLDPANLQQAGFRGDADLNFLTLPWFASNPNVTYHLSNVSLVTDCATYLQYQSYVCNNAGSQGIQVSASRIWVQKFQSQFVEAANVTILCPKVWELSPPACAVTEVRSAVDLVSALNATSGLPLLVVILQSNLSVDEHWPTSGADVVTHTVLAGNLQSNLSFDFREQRGVFRVFGKGHLFMYSLLLLNLPVGPPAGTLTFRGDLLLYTQAWFVELDEVASETASVYLQNCSLALPYEFFLYWTHWTLFASVLHEETALWISSHTQFVPYINTSGLVLYSNSSRVLQRSSMMTTCGPQCSLRSRTMELTLDGSLPLTQVYLVGTSHTLLGSIQDATLNGFHRYTVAIEGKLSLDAAVWPDSGALVNSSLLLASYSWNEQAVIDFQKIEKVFTVPWYAVLTIQNLILANLTSRSTYGPASYTAGLWGIYSNRALHHAVIVQNSTILVPMSELSCLGDTIKKVGSKLVTSSTQQDMYLDYLAVFGYVGYNIHIVADNATSFSYPCPTLVPQLSALGTCTESSSGSSSNGWMIAFAVVCAVLGTLVLLAVAGVLYFWLCKPEPRKYVAEHKHQTAVNQQVTASGRSINNAGDNGTVNNALRLQDGDTASVAMTALSTLDHMQLGTTAQTEVQMKVCALGSLINDPQLVLYELLGKGGSGEVYRACWRNLTVAVKVMAISEGDASKRQCAAQEVAVLVNVQHPNVITTYSYDMQEVAAQATAQNTSGNGSEDQSRPGRWQLFIVQEYCDGGTLREFIDNGQFMNKQTDKVDLLKVVQVALEVASGMAHVHSKNVVHGDLNPNNILMQSNSSSSYQYAAKVADFGLSVTMSVSQTHVSNLCRGTMFYAPPEVVLDGHMTKQADSFSFGIILWELYHGTPPWRKGTVKPVYNSSSLLTFAQDCPKLYRLLCKQCMNRSVSDRPSFQDCVGSLTLLQNKIQAKLVSAALPPTGGGAQEGAGEGPSVNGWMPADTALPSDTSAAAAGGGLASQDVAAGATVRAGPSLGHSNGPGKEAGGSPTTGSFGSKTGPDQNSQTKGLGESQADVAGSPRRSSASLQVTPVGATGWAKNEGPTDWMHPKNPPAADSPTLRRKPKSGPMDPTYSDDEEFYYM